MSEESTIAEQGNWDDDFKTPEQKSESQNSDNQIKIPWMKFDAPGEYRVRLFGHYVKFYRWWSPFTTRVITHLSYKDKDKAWNSGFWPRLTFAIHVIDRNDTDAEHPTGKVKILEKGSSIFEAFANYKRINKINPAGRQGPDFVIEVEWPGGNKRQAKYKVTACAAASEWTESEVNMMKSEHAEIKKIYAPTSLEKINQLWDELPDESKVPPKRDGDSKSVSSETSSPKQAPQSPIPQETVNVNDDDDLFGDDDGTGF